MTESVKQPPEPETVDLYNLNANVGAGQSSLSYENQISRITEERRAAVEGRDPDYENPGANVGTVYVTASGLLQAASVNAPDSFLAFQTQAVKNLADSDDNDLQVAVQVPVDTGEVPEEAEEPVAESAPTESTATATKTATTSKTASSSTSSTSSS